MKKLTQAVFDLPECPVWAESAAVDEDGRAYYHSKKKESLTVIPSDGDDLGLHDAYVSPPDYDRIELIGSGYDTTDWQKSAIDRGEK